MVAPGAGGQEGDAPLQVRERMRVGGGGPRPAGRSVVQLAQAQALVRVCDGGRGQVQVIQADPFVLLARRRQQVPPQAQVQIPSLRLGLERARGL